jgi:hypothetical protein
MTARPLVLLGLMLGLAAGIVAAVAIPRTHAQADLTTATMSGRPIPSPAGVVRTEAALPAPGDVHLAATAKPTIEARERDPLGGPDWAVRVFPGVRIVRDTHQVVGHPLCVQLGRLQHGVFGWLDARGTFRAEPIAATGETAECTSAKPDLGGEPVIRATSTITDPDAPAAAVRETIAWGLAGTAAQTITINKTRVGKSPHNAFLALQPARPSQHAVHVAVRYPGGRTVTGPRQNSVLEHAPGGSGPAQIVARAPDPNGGLPFALIVRGTAQHGFCSETGPRVVGDRFGSVDYLHDTFDEIRVSGGGSCSGGGGQDAQLLAEHGCLLGSSSGTGDLVAEGADPGGTGRVARRTQRGLTIVTARCADDVTTVTFTTPRDVRTLIPAGPSHAAIAVYDGNFATGGIAWTARLRDGQTKNGRIHDANF